MTNYDITAHYDGKRIVKERAEDCRDIEDALNFAIQNMPRESYSISVTVAP